MEMPVDFAPITSSIAPLFCGRINPDGSNSMPNIESAKKRVRQSEKGRVRNSLVISALNTLRRKLFEAVTAKDQAKGNAAYRAYCSALDKAAKHGIITKNTAVRRKGRAADKIRGLKPTA
jgi:small subunit ribosomal protein S20